MQSVRCVRCTSCGAVGAGRQRLRVRRARQDSRGADPRRRLQRFFQTLYGCLARGARAVLQVYPEGAAQAALLTDAAMRAGFSGGLVVDFPHSTRTKKYFLVRLMGRSYHARRRSAFGCDQKGRLDLATSARGCSWCARMGAGAPVTFRVGVAGKLLAPYTHVKRRLRFVCARSSLCKVA